ncbi:nitrate/nitrite transporter NrtS [Mastigocoleus testarum]|uniref:Uncharacterized protein n=1 Tax=Mastigocoleus testarum BC008 TaxID=371196 RepID=A0A0V7ZVH8_9CYAN|nr:nitrate/nitrite transporter NrtS [Mastigocoleus testarum]KST67990.1 hypothetical protein BC008_31900 [Mastigocoleus testarum BC008]KST68385.1 hypothetical protein BC008_33225 [Mastigocoleus testarum BC008]
MKRNLKEFGASLVNPNYAPIGVKVAIVVGSILFIINHGTTLIKGKMNQERWISATISYLVPYMVCVYGQHTSSAKHKSDES